MKKEAEGLLRSKKLNQDEGVTLNLESSDLGWAMDRLFSPPGKCEVFAARVLVRLLSVPYWDHQRVRILVLGELP